MKVCTVVALAMISSVASAQNAQTEIDAHLTAARNAAGFDFTGTLARLCVAPPFTTGIRDAAPGKPPARETWFTEPAKVFDNLYFVGSKIHSSWALTTSDGIILIDTLFTYNSEEEIVDGLKKLGLDPSKVKYVIITHAHSDHVGGAKLMQDRFKSRIIMGGPDWDAIEKSVHGYPEGKPKRDIVADDGQKLTLGDTTVTILTTPGHTPGSQSLLVHLKNSGFIILSGDVVHSEHKFEKNIVPTLNTDKAASIASMEKIKRMIGTYHAKLFINHDKAQADTLKLLPAFYD